MPLDPVRVELGFSSDGAWLCVRTRNRARSQHLFHVPSREFRTPAAGMAGTWTFSPDSAWLVTCPENGSSCTVVELGTGRETVIEPGGAIGFVAVDPTSRWLRISTKQGPDQLWQLADGEPHAPSGLPRMHEGEFSESDRPFAVQDQHQAVSSLLVERAAHVGIVAPPEHCRALRFSNGGTKVATRWSGEEAQLREVATGAVAGSWEL